MREVVFKRCLRVFNDEGRFDPQYDEGELRTVAADRVVFSIGQSIVWGDLLEGEAVELGRGQGAVAFDPQYDEGELRTVAADRVVFSIGQSIVWGDLLEGEAVELGRGQGAVANPKTYQTAQPDIFVGGDVYTGPKFAIDAIAAGHEAAVSIHRFVQDATLTIGRNPRAYRELNRDDVDFGGYDTASRGDAVHNYEREKDQPFREYVETFTEEAAVSIHRFVQDATLTIGRNPRAYRELNRDDVDFGGYDTASRGDAVHNYEREKDQPFREYVETFTEEQVRAETARCLGCGASIVDENKCIGCGLCTTKCAFDAPCRDGALPGLRCVHRG